MPPKKWKFPEWMIWRFLKKQFLLVSAWKFSLLASLSPLGIYSLLNTWWIAPHPTPQWTIFFSPVIMATGILKGGLYQKSMYIWERLNLQTEDISWFPIQSLEI